MLGQCYLPSIRRSGTCAVFDFLTSSQTLSIFMWPAHLHLLGVDLLVHRSTVMMKHQTMHWVQSCCSEAV